MNDSTLTQLKILVERAVRPVRASSKLKRKMREELLCHVTAVFEDEAKNGDEQAALTKTHERFGDVAQLTAQLQATVPSRDRLESLLEWLAGVDRRETAFRRAFRLAGVVGVFCTVALLVMIPFQGNASQWLTVARIPSVLAPLFLAGLIFFGTLIVHAMWRAMYGPHGRSWIRMFGIAVAAWLFVPVATLVVCIPFSGPSLATVDEVLPLLLFGVPAPIALILVMKFAAPELRLAAEWASLDIDAQNGAAA